jgi:hypothetical protein
MLKQFEAFSLSEALRANAVYKHTSLNPEIRAIYIQKLQEALNLCLKSCDNKMDEERHHYVAVHPEVEANEAKAWSGFIIGCRAIKRCHTLYDLMEYLRTDLKEMPGLFHQIMRGKVNKHILPRLPEDVRDELRFVPRIRNRSSFMP